mgnify:CR=1 FL=1
MTPTREPQIVARSAKTAAYSALGALALVGVLALTGCTINVAAPGSHSSMMGADKSDARGTLSDADIMFLQMMIPHHQQAVDMSTLAETRTTNPEILALAKQIKDAQPPEIAQMNTWI